MECLLPYLSMVTVPHIMVRLERMLDYRGVGLERFHCIQMHAHMHRHAQTQAQSPLPTHTIGNRVKEVLWNTGANITTTGTITTMEPFSLLNMLNR